MAYIKTLAIVSLAGVLLAAAVSAERQPAAAGSPKRGLPVWNQGDWWIISADIVGHSHLAHPEREYEGMMASMPFKLATVTVETKFIVEEPAKVDGEMCDVISIHVHRFPPGITDDTNGEWLWRLYIRKSDSTLAKYEWRLRGYPFFAKGEVQDTGSWSYERHMPAAFGMDELAPLDVPLLRYPLKDIAPLFDKDKVLSFDHDDRTTEPRKEVIEVFEDKVLGKQQKTVVITIFGPDIGYRRETWIEGYPWWVEWSRMEMNGTVRGGILRAHLVEFGNKQGVISAPQR